MKIPIVIAHGQGLIPVLLTGFVGVVMIIMGAQTVRSKIKEEKNRGEWLFFGGLFVFVVGTWVSLAITR